MEQAIGDRGKKSTLDKRFGRNRAQNGQLSSVIGLGLRGQEITGTSVRQKGRLVTLVK